jgi:hypothetical protein
MEERDEMRLGYLNKSLGPLLKKRLVCSDLYGTCTTVIKTPQAATN